MPFWTEEADQFIAACAEQGLSASIAAAKLGGGTTRNAVIGRAHRIGLSFRSGNNAWAREPKPRLKKYKPRAVKKLPPREKKKVKAFAFAFGFAKSSDELKTAAVPERIAPIPTNMPAARAVGAAKAVISLGERDCRWPIGDPQNGDFRFCGARKGRGSYCPYHQQYSQTGAWLYEQATDDEET